MTFLAALLLAAQTPASAAIAGNYTAEAEAGQMCVVILMEPARRPQGAMMSLAGAAGLAAVSPGCELGLAEAMFWQFDEEDAPRLVLVDPAGEPVFAGGLAASGEWTGRDASGVSVRLRRTR